MSQTIGRLGLFDAYGIELEYMIVDKDSLQVRPIADQVLQQLNGGSPCREVALGPIAWSNELVKHVIELKANGPTPDLLKLHQDCIGAIRQLNDLLDKTYHAKLLPSAMHPLFDPDRETQLWQDDDAEIYETYDRIFGCKGHGWSNLQSIHINLPFSSDQEFNDLHQAIRLVLPILPALAASSPMVEGKRGSSLDTRLLTYAQNQRRIPAIIGSIIPEVIASPADYERQILQPMYDAIRPHDPEGILQYEWLNSRAAIAKFEKSCIEIRILDIGECPGSDFAIIYFTTALLKWLIYHQKDALQASKQVSSAQLKTILMQLLHQGPTSLITDRDFLQCFAQEQPLSFRQLCLSLTKQEQIRTQIPRPFQEKLNVMLSSGNLAERILKSLPESATKPQIEHVYHQLASCLEGDKLYEPK